MPYPVWFIILGLCLGIAVWQFSVWQGEVRSKNKKYRDAVGYARTRNKPLLIAGGPYGGGRVRHMLKIPAHGNGDVCLDIDRNALDGHPNAVLASVTQIPFSDKAFGAVFASHLLEHLPTTGDAKQALAELDRAAEAVFITSPSRQSISGWLHPDHHLWVWQNGRDTYVKQRGEPETPLKENPGTAVMEETDPVLTGEVNELSRRLFAKQTAKQADFSGRLLDICRRVRGKDFLLIHNPGGWGGTPLPDLLEWEKSVVDGVAATIEHAGYSHLLVQHFRGGSSWWAHMLSMGEQSRFMLRGHSHLVDEMAEELRYISRRFPGLKILLIGASQGAAFCNAVMRRINDLPQVYSIEMGLIFPHMPRRLITERTLAMDSNGQSPDPIVHLNLRVTLRAYITAPYRWFIYRLQGHPRKCAYCINAPGHDYNWKYPGVSRRVEGFLQANFGTKDKLEADS